MNFIRFGGYVVMPLLARFPSLRKMQAYEIIKPVCVSKLQLLNWLADFHEISNGHYTIRCHTNAVCIHLIPYEQ
jgi:hypothetical protein